MIIDYKKTTYILYRVSQLEKGAKSRLENIEGLTLYEIASLEYDLGLIDVKIVNKFENE